MTLAQTSTKVAGAKPATAFGLTARQREAAAGYLFVLPDALGLLLFIGLPMLLALFISFFEVNGFGAFSFVGLSNYQRLWGDALFWQALRVTLAFAAMAGRTAELLRC